MRARNPLGARPQHAEVASPPLAARAANRAHACTKIPTRAPSARPCTPWPVAGVSPEHVGV